MAKDNAASASTVRALVRGTRMALFVQLFAALLALAVTIASVIYLQNLRADVREAEAAKTAALADVQAALAQRGQIIESNQFVVNGMRSMALGTSEGAEAALFSFQSAIASFAGDASVHSLQAQALRRLGRNAEAAAAMRESLRLDNTQFPNHARLATYLCAAGDIQGARAALAAAPEGFAEAFNVDPGLAEVRNEMTAACQAVGLVWTSAVAPEPPLPDTTPTPPDGATKGPAAEPPAPPSRESEQADPYRITIVYLHIRSEADRADAQRLRERLRAAGYRVPGIQLVAAPRGYSANVRYYYEPQAAQSQQITARVTAAINELGIAGWTNWTPRQVSLAGGYDNLPRDRLEVWLPERAAPAAR